MHLELTENNFFYGVFVISVIGQCHDGHCAVVVMENKKAAIGDNGAIRMRLL